jgi:hypothetical protein
MIGLLWWMRWTRPGRASKRSHCKKVPAQYVGIRLEDFVEGVYLPHVKLKRKPSTVRGYQQMWARSIKLRCAGLVMHSAEMRSFQGLLDEIEHEDQFSPRRWHV